MENDLDNRLNDFIVDDQKLFNNNDPRVIKQNKSSDTKYLDRIILAEDGRQLLSE